MYVQQEYVNISFNNKLTQSVLQHIPATVFTTAPALCTTLLYFAIYKDTQRTYTVFNLLFRLGDGVQQITMNEADLTSARNYCMVYNPYRGFKKP